MEEQEAGCEETFTVDGRNKHPFVCLYESKECPLRKLSDVDCFWTGTVSDIAADVSSEAIQDMRHFKVKMSDISRNTLPTCGTYFGGIIIFDLVNLIRNS